MAEQILTKETPGSSSRSYQLLALAGLVVLFLLPSDGLGIIFCPLKNLSGIDCPACGLTRSVSSLLHLDFSRSLAYHPLGAPALAGLMLLAAPSGYTKRINASRSYKILYHYRWQIIVTLFLIVWALRLFSGVFPN